MNRAWVVLVKELVDNLRDKRALTNTFLLSVMGPLMLIPLLGLMGRLQDTKLLTVPMDGAENAPGLVEYLRVRDIDVVPAPKDPERAVRDLEQDVVVIIPPSYADDFRAGRSATVRVVADASRTTTARAVSRVTTAIGGYGATVGALRLMARGVSPQVVSPVSIEHDDVSTPESKGASLLAIIPMFLVISLFFGGVPIVVDITAGERERASLEPLLSTPLRSVEVVLGKLGAVMTYQLGAALSTTLGFVLVLRFAPVAEVSGMRLALGPIGALQVILSVIPLLLPSASLQMLLAGRSRSAKEAQTSLSLLSNIPVIPGMMMMFLPFKATATLMTIPVVAQELLVNQILRGAPLPAFDHLIAASIETALGVCLAALAIYRYDRARALPIGR